MCLRPLTINRYDTNGQYLYSDTVACGKCFECLRAKQSGYRVRCYIEAMKTCRVDFVTLTYNSSAIPITMRSSRQYPDGFKDYSEFFYIDDFADTSHYRSDYVQRVQYVHGKRVSDCNPMELDAHLEVDEFGVDVVCRDVLCASLRRSDVQKCFKRARRSYERQQHEICPEFRYLCVGEYGSLSSRPHYHILFFGCDSLFLYNYFLQDWERNFGNTFAQTVQCSAQDFSKVSTYVSKYVTKGCFDIPHISQGFCQSPRLMVSSGLGSLSDEQIRYFRCEDLYQSIPRELDFVPDELNDPFRKNAIFMHSYRDNPADEYPFYDTNNIFNHILYKNYVDLSFFTPDQVSSLWNHFDYSGYIPVLEALERRGKITIGKFELKYPEYYKRLYWDSFITQFSDDGTKHTKVLHPAAQIALKAFKILRYYKLHFEELAELQRSLGIEDIITAEMVSRDQHECDIRSREASCYQNLKTFYQRTIYN